MVCLVNRIIVTLFDDDHLGEKSFFKPHKDTPRGESMFGSLVIVFPTVHEGGALVLRHHGQEWTFDSATVLSERMQPSLAYIAFYSDVEHEVMPIKSGYRITVTYNLYFDSTPSLVPKPDANIEGPNVFTTRDARFPTMLKKLLADPSFLPKGGLLGFGLRHEYPLPRHWNSLWHRRTSVEKKALNSFLEFLKGSDAVVREAFQTLGLKVSLRIVYNVESKMIMCKGVADFGGDYIGDTSTQDILCMYFGGVYLKDSRKNDHGRGRYHRHDVEDVDEDSEDDVKNTAGHLDVDPEERRTSGNEAEQQAANKARWDDSDSDMERDDTFNSWKTNYVEKTVRVHWVTPLTTVNEIEETFLVYGNEPSLGCTYGHICLIAKVLPFKLRSAVDATD